MRTFRCCAISGVLWGSKGSSKSAKEQDDGGTGSNLITSATEVEASNKERPFLRSQVLFERVTGSWCPWGVDLY